MVLRNPGIRGGAHDKKVIPAISRSIGPLSFRNLSNGSLPSPRTSVRTAPLVLNSPIRRVSSMVEVVDVANNIFVAVRMRKKDPAAYTSFNAEDTAIIDIQKKQKYPFNIVFDETATQDNVYKLIGNSVITAASAGYNTTIFAYGQTGCFAAGTRITLYDRSEKNVEDITVADILLGDDMTPRNVISLFSGIQRMYNISNSYIVNHDHILVLRKRSGDIVEIPVYELLNKDSAQYSLIRIIESTGRYSSEWIPLTIQYVHTDEYYGFELDGNHRFIGASGHVLRNSGKTHTMFGENDGIIPRIVAQLYEGQSPTIEYKVELTYVEIYAEKVYDLLIKNSPPYSVGMSADGGYIDGIMPRAVGDYNTCMGMIMCGMQNRTTAATALNRYSSRSHALCIINFTQIIEHNGKKRETFSKINLVDLAGSENVKQSGVTSVNLKEAIEINKSLSALAAVISALSDRPARIATIIPPPVTRRVSTTAIRRTNSSTEQYAHHIPYRDSILTKILSSSLGGNSKTYMIATILSDTLFYKESINTLKYASIAKTIRNKPHINENDSDELVSGLREEISVLRKKLADAELMNSPTSTIKQLRDELEYREQRIKDRDKNWQARVDESKEAFNSMVKKLEEEKTSNRQLLEQIETLQRGSEIQRSIVADTHKATIEFYEEKLNHARTSDMTQESEKRIIDLQNRILTLSTKDFELTECRAKYDELMTRYHCELNQKETEFKKVISDMEKENAQLRQRIAQLSAEKCGFLKRLQLVEKMTIKN